MNYKDNGGVDPITLKQGYKKLEGDPPNSGESVFNPRHVAEDKAVEAMVAAGEWPDEKEDDGVEGFLERDVPEPYDRPFRSSKEDRG